MLTLHRRSAAVVIPLLIAGCSSPSSQDGNTATGPDEGDGSISASASSTLANTAAGAVTADTPVTSDNYAEVMAARAREYDGLEYKPVTLVGFECGDNCYLELTAGVEGAAPETVLCTASLCADWQASGSLPPALRNKGATARFGTADQVDGSGTVMERDMRAVVDLRVRSAGKRSASSPTPPAAGGTLPLERGVYVVVGTGCKSPANATIRIWNGSGLSGSATRNCRPTILSRTGNTYIVSNSCENTYDGSRTVERQTITVGDRTHFTLKGQHFGHCASGTAPASLETLAR